MATYYVGTGGSNANSGTSWAQRRLTIASGLSLMSSGGTDTLYIGPGTYRENPSTSVNGASSNPHTVIGDESGVNTDGIGGEIRITGSDNDQTATRANGITCANNWWVFRGLHIDTTTTNGYNITGNNVVVDQGAIQYCPTLVSMSGAGCNNVTLRRCVAAYFSSAGISIAHSATVDNTGHIIENCQIHSGVSNAGVLIQRVGGITVHNTLIQGCVRAVQCSISPSAGQVNNINNSIIVGCGTGFQATATTDLTEDYNTIFSTPTARSNVNVGANSKAWNPLLTTPLLTLGIHSWIFGELASYSQLASIAGTGVPTDDLVARTRVATSSWGPMQYVSGQRFNDISPLKRFGGL